jgi:hypothetical protein
LTMPHCTRPKRRFLAIGFFDTMRACPSGLAVQVFCGAFDFEDGFPPLNVERGARGPIGPQVFDGCQD